VNLNLDVLTYIFSGLFALGIFVFVFYPGDESAQTEDKTRLTYLYERKDVIYENLRDLNFEHKSGKFTKADFEKMRQNMEAEAARVLEEIEKLETISA